VTIKDQLNPTTYELNGKLYKYLATIK